MRRPGDIKVIGEDRMCFYVDPVTLEPRSCGSYDAYAIVHPEPPEMSVGKWSQLRNQQHHRKAADDLRARGVLTNAQHAHEISRVLKI